MKQVRWRFLILSRYHFYLIYSLRKEKKCSMNNLFQSEINEIFAGKKNHVTSIRSCSGKCLLQKEVYCLSALNCINWIWVTWSMEQAHAIVIIGIPTISTIVVFVLDRKLLWKYGNNLGNLNMKTYLGSESMKKLFGQLKYENLFGQFIYEYIFGKLKYEDII